MSNNIELIHFFISLLALSPVVVALSPSSSRPVLETSATVIENRPLSRRDAWNIPISLVGATIAASISPFAAFAEEGIKVTNYAFESRNRNKNKNALIRDDIWYFSGQTPPRMIDLRNLPEGPKWNAWGTCAESASGNSCTYVSLKQKIPAYSNYAFLISLGAKEFTDLGVKIQELSSQSQITDNQIISLLEYVKPGEAKMAPSPAVDAQLKMVLFSTAVLTSPNYTGPPFELLIARFYINELNFATNEIATALRAKDIARARAAWEYGRDSWNSYFTIVNKAIVSKVGDQFTLIA